MGAIPRGSGGFLTAPHAYPAATMNSSALPRTRVHRNLTLGLLVVLLGWSIGSLSGNDLETARTAVILGILLIVSLPLFWMIARSDPDGGALLALLFAAFAVKLGAVYFRLHFALLADAYAYDFYGREIAAALEVGRWHEAAGYQRTALIRLLTGLLYTITGPAFYGASVLWGWLGLLGMMFYYKAFSTAFPNGDRRLYMLLILFYPSLQLWKRVASEKMRLSPSFWDWARMVLPESNAGSNSLDCSALVSVLVARSRSVRTSARL